MSPAERLLVRPTVESWRDWRGFLASLPTNPERVRMIGAIDRGLAGCSPSDPMFGYHPNDWTPDDIDRHLVHNQQQHEIDAERRTA